mmetsp:Transcript_7174/g.15665  ORF Transcript_7174/g.15665 Transcript_7174/m.15665 type:complete len:205 (+) Transcript_7174:824-1438(+)
MLLRIIEGGNSPNAQAHHSLTTHGNVAMRRGESNVVGQRHSVPLEVAARHPMKSPIGEGALSVAVADRHALLATLHHRTRPRWDDPMAVGVEADLARQAAGWRFHQLPPMGRQWLLLSRSAASVLFLLIRIANALKRSNLAPYPPSHPPAIQLVSARLQPDHIANIRQRIAMSGMIEDANHASHRTPEDEPLLEHGHWFGPTSR